MRKKVAQPDIVEFKRVKKEVEIQEQSAQPRDVPPTTASFGSVSFREAQMALQ